MHLYRKTKEESGKGLNYERSKDIKLTFVGDIVPYCPVTKDGLLESDYLVGI